MKAALTNRTDWPLSGSTLKLMGMVFMTIDHFAAFALKTNRMAHHVFASIGKTDVSLVNVMRFMGRWAFPIFCFLLVQGFIHTRDKRRYGCCLFLFALLSEWPFDALVCGGWNMDHQNVLFSLLFGYIGMSLYETFKHDWFNRVLAMLMMTGVVLFSGCDYGLRGFLCIMTMYIFRKSRYAGAGGCLLLPATWATVWAAIPIALYNGRRGFIQSRLAKYLFYIFYPAHMLVIYILRSL